MRITLYEPKSVGLRSSDERGQVVEGQSPGWRSVSNEGREEWGGHRRLAPVRRVGDRRSADARLCYSEKMKGHEVKNRGNNFGSALMRMSCVGRRIFACKHLIYRGLPRLFTYLTPSFTAVFSGNALIFSRLEKNGRGKRRLSADFGVRNAEFIPAEGPSTGSARSTGSGQGCAALCRLTLVPSPKTSASSVESSQVQS